LDFKHTDITELIIKTFYKVYNTLSYGFLEKITKTHWQQNQSKSA